MGTINSETPAQTRVLNHYSKEEWDILRKMIPSEDQEWYLYLILSINGSDDTILSSLDYYKGPFKDILKILYETSIDEVGTWVNNDGILKVIFKWRMQIGH